MPRFNFVSWDKFVNEPRVITDRDLETAYRRGYSQGYAVATQDLSYLIKAGYTRIKEILNFLNGHADTIYMGWRVRHARREPCGHLPPNLKVEPWQTLRRKVLERDGHACVFCGSAEDLQVDHVEQVQHGGVAREDNLRVLCGSCNRGRNVEGRA